MSPQAIDAFNSASGIQMTDLEHFILTLFFVAAIFWAVILLTGKMKAFGKSHEIDSMHLVITVVRVLAVLVIVLLLVNV